MFPKLSPCLDAILTSSHWPNWGDISECTKGIQTLTTQCLLGSVPGVGDVQPVEDKTLWTWRSSSAVDSQIHSLLP